ncbi:hypothetical protein EI94DRAFT_1692741 [Lactarius quietus]|nr:hypothetical protein EI94DRAFT_1692741 [Lactarius quietus]
MKPEVPPWLTELHSKIWNRVDLTQTLTRTVEVTEAHYTALQHRLNGLHDRMAINLVKLNILHSLREAVPSLQDEVESDVSEARDNHKLFPSVFKYLDLAPLGLKAEVMSRFPLPLLIREDYEDMTKLIDKEPQNNSGSVIVSGQPGTGECPFLFQSNLGTVYHVTKESVEIIGSWSSPDPIRPLLMATRGLGTQRVSHRPSVQLIVAASPKVASQKWTKQTGHGSFISQFAIKLWSRKELLLTGLFLHPSNLSLELLEESASYFGFNPHVCFQAALSVQKMDRTKAKVIDAIDKAANEGIDKLVSLISGARSGASTPSSWIFQIYPAPDDEDHSLPLCHVSITRWALRHLVNRLKERGREKVFTLYDSISKIPAAAPFAGGLLEMQVLRYLDHISTKKMFTIRRLANSNPDEMQWIYPGPTKHVNFDLSTAHGQIEEAIRLQLACHLVPLAPNFPAVDSIIYDPNDKVLTCIQITRNVDHPIAISGLRDIQSWLKLCTASAKLRPSKVTPWCFLFVVPEAKASTFKPQTFKGDTDKGEWAGKVDQYVLGLKDQIIFELEGLKVV